MPVKFLAEERYAVKAEGALLEISSAGLLDTARFKCTARNEAGTSTLAYAIEVQIPPKITSQNLLNDGEDKIYLVDRIFWDLDPNPQIP